MDISQVAALLSCKREEVITAINLGVELPKSKKKIKIKATPNNKDFSITDKDLDDFIVQFEEEEPGRHPPVSVCRELLVEANHRCAICGDSSPLQYHHIIEFSTIKHHDPKHMLAICGTDHAKINRGEIDIKAQQMYKEKLLQRSLSRKTNLPREELFPFIGENYDLAWDDIAFVINELHKQVTPSKNIDTMSKYDFSTVDIKKKNELNNLSKDYFQMMVDHHEPYFRRIDNFLGNPATEDSKNRYHEIVDEIRSIIASNSGQGVKLEDILFRIKQIARSNEILNDKIRTLNILLSYMYLNCDIGKKI
ncbi:HNH endonuclease [bacterium]|nr:HNH endonuclease [bacterium]